MILAAVAYAAPPGKQTFTGVVTDSMCADGNHKRMQMGPTDAECTKACVSIHGATYVLYDGKASLDLSDQKMPEKFAGQKVTVTGTLDAKAHTVHVESITTSK